MSGYTTLCGTGWYANEVGCSVGNWIDDFITNAKQAETALDQALVDLTAAYDANTTTPTYAPDLSGISYLFVAPMTAPTRGNYATLQPVEVALPNREGLLTDTQSDAIFARARARVTRAANAIVRSALEQPASLGIGMAAPAVLRRVAEANQKKLESITQVALEQAAQEGVWEREDIKTVLALELQNFKDKWAVIQGRLAAEEETWKSSIAQFTSELQKEAERRGWSELETNALLKEAQDAANVAIQWGQVTLNKLIQAEEIIVKMKAAVFQAWLQSASLSMSFSASQALTSADNN